MANKADTKKAKDAATIAKAISVAKAKKVEAAKVKAMAESVNTAKAVSESTAPITIVGGTDHKPVTNEHKASESIDASRYKPVQGAFGMLVKAGMEKAKPEAAEYEVTDHNAQFAETFASDDDKAILAGLNSLGDDLGNVQGKLACICAGIAAKLQKEGSGALPILNALIDACESWGKRLTMVRVNEIRQWFTAYACVDIEKSAFVFNKTKHMKEGAKFGRSQDAWIRHRIAKPFWLYKPEKELGEYEFMAEMTKFMERAAKLMERASKTTNVKEIGYNTIDFNGYEALNAAYVTLKRTARKLPIPPATETKDSESKEQAANAA